MSYAATHGALEDALEMTLGTGHAATKVVQDPHLPEVICQVMRLNAIEEGRPLGAPCPRRPLTYATGQGIGLRYAVVPLRSFVKVREKPLVGLAVGVSIVAGLVGVGYLLGRKA